MGKHSVGVRLQEKLHLSVAIQCARSSLRNDAFKKYEIISELD